jgi:hypothetical protein
MTANHKPSPEALNAIDKLTTAVDDNLGRLAVLERLCWLMSANLEYDNNQTVDFGDVREQAFWHGLHQLAEAAAEATEEIQAHGNALYDEVPAREAKTDGPR